MTARLTMQDVIANNLANANSTGFQRQMVAVQAYTVTPPTVGATLPSAPADAAKSAMATEIALYQDTQPGILKQTGNKGDVALQGEGYFVAETAKGPRLFRSNTLQPNAQGYLSLPTGELVQGAGGGSIAVGTRSWAISAQGTIEADGQVLGRLRVVRPDGDVTPEGGGFSVAPRITELPPSAVTVRSGYLEHSNVEPMREMVEMIAGMRAYEAGQRAIQAQDQTLQNLFTLLQ